MGKDAVAACGWMALLVLWSSVLWADGLAHWKPVLGRKAVPERTEGTVILHWGDGPRQGPFPTVPGLVQTEVDAPDGDAPSLDDLESLQYHHHTRVAVDRGGRIWVAYSGAMRREGESGMITEVKSSVDGLHWSTPLVMVAPASAMDGGLKAGRRISYPRAFVSQAGRLYLVAAIDQANGEGCCTNEQGEALVAARLYRDGRVGRTFRVSRAEYRPIPGFPDYAYNARVGRSLFQQANLFGTWGGSAPEQPASEWVGYGRTNSGNILVEPNTIRLLRHPNVLVRLWRDEGKIEQFVMEESISKDNGRSWSPVVATDIPNSPSETTLIALKNGTIAVIGNARDESTAQDARDPLYLAILDGMRGNLIRVDSVREGLGAAVYDNGVNCGPDAKPCGASYPGAFERDGKLYISYSVDKQQIWLAIVPEKNLPVAEKTQTH